MKQMQQKQLKEQKEQKSPIDILFELVTDNKNISFFKDVDGENYVTYDNNGADFTVTINSVDFKEYLKVIYHRHTKKAINNNCVETVQEQLDANCKYDSEIEECHVFSKVGVDDNNTYYYKLNNYRFIKYSKEGYQIIDKAPVKFIKNDKLLGQVEPNFSASYDEIFDIIDDNFNISSDEEIDVFITWLFYCFIPDSSFKTVHHQILIITGSQGSGKSTALEMISKIISPSSSTFNSISNEENLINKLSNSYLSTFDNVRKLSNNMQDHLCRACTGGTYTKRKLFKNNQMCQINYKSIIAINGISGSLASNSDFLERCVLVDLSKIIDDDRKTLQEVWDKFNQDLPKLLGIIFKLLPEVLKEIENVTLHKSPRFKDFAIFGTALFNIIDPDVSFINSYYNVINKTKQHAIDSNIVIETLVLMINESKFCGTLSNLIKELYIYADDNEIILPLNMQPNKISELLEHYSGVLKDFGINIKRRRSNGKRIVEIYI